MTYQHDPFRVRSVVLDGLTNQALKEGDIIPLDPKRLNQVEVQLAGLTKYTGSLGSFDKKTAVQIRDTFKS